ncbi:DUF929 domain-containing protein [Ktedonosporobacter rubrisoli]|uniref:DUF929 domain-containing protein n=1 Tax=Ktedonosporobacter rubrisoli TaxID=2509675 RepID=A0A4V0YZ48_KTERU|nr:DUF929 family protein [Ktedonosporobacter rubrisoli]QBD78471.1 DUF929 domain-containing protein [Ktedonosporobacter rubrisoli]
MAKTKRHPSAAQRREQERSGRQERLRSAQNIRANKNRRRANNSTWYWIGGIVALVVVVVVAFVFLARQPATPPAVPQGPTAQANFKDLTKVDPTLLASIGTGNAQNLMKPLPGGTPAAKGPDGKPQFFYMGGEFCPFCGAQRWSMIVALSRFGTFSQLSPIISGEDSVPSYTFHGSTYSSQYVDFVSVETSDNQGVAFEKPTAEQMQLFQKYDAPPYTSEQNKGSIPFILIGNQFTSTGSYFDPQVLIGHSHEDIIKQLKDPNSAIARGVLGSANYLTAAICNITQNQPADVCTAKPIPQIQQSLPRASIAPAGPPLAMAAASQDLIVRREQE